MRHFHITLTDFFEILFHFGFSKWILIENGIKETGWFKNSGFLSLNSYLACDICYYRYNYNMFLCYIYYICYYVAMRIYK